MGAIQRVAQRAGAARAKEMAMLGRCYTARTLERWNVINRVVEDEQLDAASMTLARRLAGGPTWAHAATEALVSVAVRRGVAAADEAMAERQRPAHPRGGGAIIGAFDAATRQIDVCAIRRRWCETAVGS
jgi:enoyl-CoA hydratase/carnithine racemase